MSEKNIILITLDGFRKDKIGLCPSLKSIKENSYYFSEMNTNVPYTFAAHHLIFSGMYIHHVMVLMVTTKCSISKKMK